MLTVDRIERNIAVCIDNDSGRQCDIFLSELPGDVKEGDILKKLDGRYVTDKNETKLRQKDMRGRLDQLFGK